MYYGSYDYSSRTCTEERTSGDNFNAIKLKAVLSGQFKRKIWDVDSIEKRMVDVKLFFKSHQNHTVFESEIHTNENQGTQWRIRVIAGPKNRFVPELNSKRWKLTRPGNGLPGLTPEFVGYFVAPRRL